MSTEYRHGLQVIEAARAALPGMDRVQFAASLAMALGIALADAAWPEKPSQLRLVTSGGIIGAAANLRSEQLAAQLRQCAGQA